MELSPFTLPPGVANTPMTNACIAAIEVIKQRNLLEWLVCFNSRQGRPVCCDRTLKTISLSRKFVELNPIDQVRAAIERALPPDERHVPVRCSWGAVEVRP